jgi:hypothetical protein
MHGPVPLLWSHWRLTDPHLGHCFTSSLRPWFITMVRQNVRRPCIYLLFCRDRVQTSYVVSQRQQHTKMSLGHWRAFAETTSWQWPIILNWKPGPRGAASRYKNSQSPLSNWPPGPCCGTRGLHPKGDSLCVHKKSEEQGSETAPVRPWEVRAGAPTGTWLPVTELCGTGWPECSQCEDVGHVRRQSTETSWEELSERTLTGTQKMGKARYKEEGAPSTSSLISHSTHSRRVRSLW